MPSHQQLLPHPTFTYYCSNCFTFIHTTTTLLMTGYATQKLVNCPECNQPLRENLIYRKTYTPTIQSKTDHMLIPTKRDTTPPLIFQTAAYLLGLTSGVSRIDSIIGGLKERTHLLILGGFSNTLAERFCQRSLLPRDSGGLDTNPIFIDAGNCSDPYLFASYARRYHIEPKRALQRVLTSRVFTVHQLANLILKELPNILRQYSCKLVVIAELLSMFNVPQIERHEVERIVEEIGQVVQEIRDEKNLIVISTTTEKSGLAEPLLKRADIALEIEPVKNRSAIMNLIKHPEQQHSTVALRQNELFEVTVPKHKPREVLAYG